MVAIEAAPWTNLRPETFAVDGLSARFEATPTSPEALAEILGRANQEGLAVTPRGGNTHMRLGNPPARVDLALDTTALNRIVEYEPADLTLTVEAGARLSDVQATLAEQGQFLALDPPTQPEATIGGVIATNASGPLRFSSGSARDLVIGTRVANADGRLTRAGGRVVKNVAGYDLNKLYVGSLGTLGVIVELSFKVAPIPPVHGLVVARMPDYGAAARLLSSTVHSQLAPLAAELLGASAAAALGLAGGPVIALRLGGYEQVVTRQRRDLARLVEEHGGRPGETSWELITRLQSDASRWDIVLKAAVPLAHSAALVELLERNLERYTPVVWARGGNGIAYAAIDAPPDDPAALAGDVEAVRSAVRALGDNASLVLDRAPSELKRRIDVWGDAGDGLPLMRALKQQLDPRMTLNPGRYVGGI